MDELFPKTKWNDYIQEVNKEIIAKDGNKLEQMGIINEKYREMVELYKESPKDYPWSLICSWHQSWMTMCGETPMDFLYLYPPMTNEAMSNFIKNTK